MKCVTYCCVQHEKGDKCSQALNITTAGSGSMINYLSAKHGILLQQGLCQSLTTVT